MCYHVATPSKKKLVQEWKGMKIALPESYSSYFHVSGFQHPLLPAFSSQKPQTISAFRWGLIPEWIADEKAAAEIQNKTLNAKGETLFEKASFKTAVKQERCILLTNGFFEWHTKGKRKYPYFIHSKNDAFTFIGGIVSQWVHPFKKDDIKTFSIVTVPANSMMKKIHNIKKRMPFILSEEKQRKQWLKEDLDQKELKKILSPSPSESLEAWTVDRKLNHFQSMDCNTKDITKEIHYPELNHSAEQLNLFFSSS